MKAMTLNMAPRMQKGLTPQAFQVVQRVKRLADDTGVSLYLVGGAVRDLLLGLNSSDLDFVIEPDAIRFARLFFAQQAGGDLVVHDRFGTAMWEPPERIFPRSIDFVTARKERYAEPAALPTVTPSGIKDDLFRRDFTINALAIQLDGERYGRLIDQHHGHADLKNGVIRILHPDSFVDDPTRIWRAVRYAERLRFEIEPRTEQAIPAGLTAHTRLSADRIRHELEKVLEEDERCAEILLHLDRIGLLRSISERLRVPSVLADRLRQLMPLFQSEPKSGLIEKRRDSRFHLLLWGIESADPAENLEIEAEISETLRLSKELTQTWRWLRETADRFAQADPGVVIEPLEVVQRLNKRSHLDLQLLELRLRPYRLGHTLLTRYQAEWGQVKVSLNGHDLIKMGVQPGPRLGELLDALYGAKLKGGIPLVEDERRYVEQALHMMNETVGNDE